MAASVVPLLARALSVSMPEAERALAEAVDRLRRELDESGRARLEGVGTFRKTEGRLVFEADVVLAQAVNHRYAGLPSVPAAGAVATEAPAEASEEEPYEDPFASAVVAPSLDLPEQPASEEPIRDLNSEERPDGPGEQEETPEPDEAGGAREAIDVPDWGGQPPGTEPREAEPHEEEPQQAAGEAHPWADEPSEEEVPHELGPVAGRTEDAAEAPVPEATPLPPDEPELPSATAPPDELPPPDPDDQEEINKLLAGVWTPRSGPADEAHPLGPMPSELMEDADFSVVGGRQPAETSPPGPPPADRSETGAPAGADAFPLPPPGPPSPQEPPAPAAASKPYEVSRSAGFPPAPEPEESERHRRGAIVGILLGLLALAIIGGAAWWWLAAPTAPEPITADTAPIAPPEEAPEAIFPAPETDDPVEPDFEEPAPAETPDTPLRSAAGIDPARGGYTWVVASEGTSAEAEQIAERYQEAGYRAAVLPATVRGRTVYRVGVGQFATPAEAERYRNDLPPFAPSDTWRLTL